MPSYVDNFKNSLITIYQAEYINVVFIRARMTGAITTIPLTSVSRLQQALHMKF